MSKAVILSIHPKWAEKIYSGEKEVEWRKTFPTWYKWECSDSQAYRMLGNGWTVEVIKHFFSFLPWAKKE